MPAFIAGKQVKSSEKRALELLDYLNLSARASHKPSELSGGEQQRLAFARVLLRKPRWVFADEATSALDEPTQQRVYQALLAQVKAAHGALVSISHSPAVAALLQAG